MNLSTESRGGELLSPQGLSIWGATDYLNNRESSIDITNRVADQIYQLKSNTVYTGIRMGRVVGEFKTPLLTYPFDAHEYVRKVLPPIEETPTAINGPLTQSEAVAMGYLLESSEIAQAMIEGRAQIIYKTPNPNFDAILKKLGGQPSFLYSGIMTLNDWIARMAHYRSVKDLVTDEDLDVNDEDDLAYIIQDYSKNLIPLTHAFETDKFTFGFNVNNIIRDYYAGVTQTVPFSEHQPRSKDDAINLGVCLLSSIKLFIRIESAFQYTNW